MIPKVIRGGGFRGALNYVFETRRMPDGSLFIPRPSAGNMSGDKPRDLSREFSAVRKLRPDITKPVWHCPISLPPGEYVSDQKFGEIAESFMQSMGFTKLHPWTFVIHREKDHLHGHVIASRIGLNSSVWHGKNEAKTAIKACRKIEKEFGLTEVKSYTQERKKENGNEFHHHHTFQQDSAPPKFRAANGLRKLCELRLAAGQRREYKGVLQIDVRTTRRDFDPLRREPGIQTRVTRLKGSQMTQAQVMAERKSQAVVNANIRAERNGTRLNDLNQIRASVFECLESAKDIDHFKQLIARHGLDAEYRTREDGKTYGWKLREKGAEEWLSASHVSRAFSWSQVVERIDQKNSEKEALAQAPVAPQADAHAEAERAQERVTKTLHRLSDDQLRQLLAEAKKKQQNEAQQALSTASPELEQAPISELFRILLDVVVRMVTLGRYRVAKPESHGHTVQGNSHSPAEQPHEIEAEARSILVRQIEAEQRARAQHRRTQSNSQPPHLVIKRTHEARRRPEIDDVEHQEQRRSYDRQR